MSVLEVADLIEQSELVINDGYRAKNSELSDTGFPFARAGNINNGFLFEDADRFPKENIDKVGIKLSEAGDVVFTSKGTVGRFAFVKEESEKFVYSPQLCFWRSLKHDKIYPRWLYYWMNGKEFLTQVHGVSNQSDMAAYVSLRDQRAFQISIPPLATQKAIAHILGTLDDKIELNRQTNKTLEDIAKAIFKSWFIDFDPVRYKRDGRVPNATLNAPYSLSPEILSLFSDSFQDSELGEIPAGWSVEQIGDAVKTVGGATPSTKEEVYWAGGTHYWATPKDMSHLVSPIILGTSRKITTEGTEKISSGVLPEGTVLLSSRAPVGYLAISRIPISINQGFIGLLPNKKLNEYYLLNWCEFSLGVIKSRSGGTTFQEISKKNFRPINVIVPNKGPMDKFKSIVKPLYQNIESNLRETETLSDLRDTLLPKLIYGGLPIKNAEKFLVQAGV